MSIELLKELLLMFKDNPQNFLNVDLRVSGAVLLDHGIGELAAKFGRQVKAEPGEDGDYYFYTAQIGDVEIVQVEDAG